MHRRFLGALLFAYNKLVLLPFAVGSTSVSFHLKRLLDVFSFRLIIVFFMSIRSTEEFKCESEPNMLKRRLPVQGSSEVKKITDGFLLSVVAGVLVLVNGISWFVIVSHFSFITGTLGVGDSGLTAMLILPFIILGSVGILFAIGILIGAAFTYLYGNKSTGGKIVIAFSILSIATGGGLIIGMIIGIVGGAYGIQKK
jgi:hypothetical protein